MRCRARSRAQRWPTYPLSTDELVPEARWLTDRYEFQRELGRGGVAVVYLARERAGGRMVAIKLLGSRHAGDDESMRRFAREARTVAKLDHPNIVRTLAIEEIRGSAVAIVSAYVPSQTLRAALRESGPLSFDRTAGILRDVASALVYAHEQRIVHRDVKPENIFLDTTAARALLADFGIARTLDGDTLLTAAGMAVGTPSYMAPEQIRGGEVDERADVYALGLVGWELLTGQRPWDGETLYQVLHKQQHEHLPTLADLRPGVPDYLRIAIEGALPKAPADRWRDASELLARLDAGPVDAGPIGVTSPGAESPPAVDAAVDTGAVAVADATTLRVPLDPGHTHDAGAPSWGQPSRPPAAARSTARRRWPAAVAGGAAVLLAGLALTQRTRPPAALDPALDAMLVAAARAATDSAALAGSAVASPAGPEPTSPEPTSPEPASRAPRTRVESAGRLAEPAPPRNRALSSRAACASESRAAQRSCLMTAIVRNDAALTRTYRALIGELRRRAGGAAEPSAVRALRADQRAWVDARDRACRAEARGASGADWARALTPCFAAQTDRRTAALQARLRALRR